MFRSFCDNIGGQLHCVFILIVRKVTRLPSNSRVRSQPDSGELFPHSSTSRRVSCLLAALSPLRCPVSTAPTAAFAAAVTFELYP